MNVELRKNIKKLECNLTFRLVNYFLFQFEKLPIHC